MSGITIPTLDEITGHTVMAKLRSLCKKFIGLAEEVDEIMEALKDVVLNFDKVAEEEEENGET